VTFCNSEFILLAVLCFFVRSHSRRPCWYVFSDSMIFLLVKKALLM